MHICGIHAHHDIQMCHKRQFLLNGQSTGNNVDMRIPFGPSSQRLSLLAARPEKEHLYILAINALTLLSKAFDSGFYCELPQLISSTHLIPIAGKGSDAYPMALL